MGPRAARLVTLIGVCELELGPLLVLLPGRCLTERRLTDGEVPHGEPHELVGLIFKLSRAHVNDVRALERREVNVVLADRVRLLHEDTISERTAYALANLQPGPVASSIANRVAEVIVKTQMLEARWAHKPYAHPLLLADDDPNVAFEVQPWLLGSAPVGRHD
eukprot:708637-Prymnesium_polylepis.1